MTYDSWKATNPADAELGSAKQPPTVVDRYHGFPITVETDHYEEGREAPTYVWQHGDGDSLEAVRADIDDFVQREWEGGPPLPEEEDDLG